MVITENKCSSCGWQFATDETPNVWRDKPVCAPCRRRLESIGEQAAARFSRPAAPATSDGVDISPGVLIFAGVAGLAVVVIVAAALLQNKDTELIGRIVAGLGILIIPLLVLWAVIKSAVLSALREHERTKTR